MNFRYLFLGLLAVAMVATGRMLAQDLDSTINLRRTTTVNVVDQAKHAVVYISSRKIVSILRIERSQPVALPARQRLGDHRAAGVVQAPADRLPGPRRHACTAFCADSCIVTCFECCRSEPCRFHCPALRLPTGDSLKGAGRWVHPGLAVKLRQAPASVPAQRENRPRFPHRASG